jgi:hypothetical protein
LLAPLLAGALLALAGGYWDDAWHTERGRDEFLSAPHLAIYGGVALAGGALAVWAGLAARRLGLSAALRHPPLALALASVALTLASGPIDNAWHLAFGRDAVIWSAPHMLGIVGTAGLAAAVLLEVAGSPGRWAALQPVAGALLLAALAFLVVEYETDVPQFDAVWYLPVLATGSALALGTVRLLGRRRWSASAAAAVHLALISGVALFLLALGFDAPQLPLLVVPAAALDVSTRRGSPMFVRAVVYVAALYAAYVPLVDGVGDGVYLDAGDVLLGLPVAMAGVWLLFAALTAPAPRWAEAAWRALATALVLSALVAAAPALAHDPGQGPDAGAAALEARADGRLVRLDARLLRPDCRRFARAAIVARRAGRTRRAPMVRRGCRFSGRLRPDQRGRWFVYAEFHGRGETLESWLPVKVDGGSARFSAPRRYVYVAEDRATTAPQAIAAAGLYGLILAFGAWAVVLVRRAARVSGQLPEGGATG